MEILPDDIQRLIKEYSSDRVGVHPSAQLIKELTFTPYGGGGDGGGDSIHCTSVETDGNCYFRKPMRLYNDWMPTGRLRFFHSDFDERLHPHHFGIHLRWENMLEQDKIDTAFNALNDASIGRRLNYS
jgi:hypothetical protein